MSQQFKNYYNIKEASEIINCNPNDLIHYGAIGRCKLPIYVDTDNEVQLYMVINFSDKYYFTFSEAFYYLECKDLIKLDLDKDLVSINVKTLEPAPNLAIGGGKSYNHYVDTDKYTPGQAFIFTDFVMFFSDPNYYHTVNRSDLLISHDDLMALKNGCLGFVPGVATTTDEIISQNLQQNSNTGNSSLSTEKNHLKKRVADHLVCSAKQ